MESVGSHRVFKFILSGPWSAKENSKTDCTGTKETQPKWFWSLLRARFQVGNEISAIWGLLCMMLVHFLCVLAAWDEVYRQVLIVLTGVTYLEGFSSPLPFYLLPFYIAFSMYSIIFYVQQPGVLDGVVICVSKKLVKSQGDYNDIADSLGAEYKWLYDESCTHFVFKVSNKWENLFSSCMKLHQILCVIIGSWCKGGHRSYVATT